LREPGIAYGRCLDGVALQVHCGTVRCAAAQCHAAACNQCVLIGPAHSLCQRVPAPGALRSAASTSLPERVPVPRGC
jgi:hypothetical protein